MSVENPLALDHPHFPGYNTHKASIFSIWLGFFSPSVVTVHHASPQTYGNARTKGLDVALGHG